MPSSSEILKKIAFPFDVDYIPRRGRKIQTGWAWASQSVTIPSGTRSEMDLAFRISRMTENDRAVIDVYADEQGHWWPIGLSDSPSNIHQFFHALEKGYPEALGLLGVGFHVPLKHIAKDIAELEIRETHRSSFDDLTARCHIAAQNVRIIDDQHIYVRGGLPTYFFYSSQVPGELVVDVCNSGFDFGRPVPVLIPPDGRFYWLDQMNIKTFVEGGYFSGPNLLGELQGRHVDAAKVAYISEIDCRLPDMWLVDKIELELQVLCRDLIDWLDQKLNMPPGLFCNLEIFQSLGRHRKPTVTECATALLNFREWRGSLEQGLWLKFKREDRHLQRRIAMIERHCGETGRSSPFAFPLDPDDEQSLRGLDI
jgi:hypothetical protein